MKKNKKKILIIEDERIHLEMYQSRFEKAGYQVLTALDGRKGLKLAQNEKPDLIVLDILMPKMNGYEVIKGIKGDSQIQKIPIFVLSNLGQQEEINRGLKLGADDYVVKTDLTPTELLNKVERMLNQQKPSKKIKRRVLIIENEEEIAQLYQTRLIKEGFEVEIANDGARGLQMASHGDFDIILLEMTMPAFNGYEAIREIKGDPRTEKIPVLVMSNSAQEGEINQALKVGAENYLIKSKITPAQVAEEIKKILGNKNK